MLLFDIETNGLDPDVIHCIVTIDPATGEVRAYHDDPSITPRHGSLAEGIRILEAQEGLIGHNILDYDIPVLQKLKDFTFRGDVRDTLVMSRLAYSDRRERDFALHSQERIDPQYIGQHSLGSWGNRLGFPKGEWTEWETFSQGMLDYCIQDCKVNLKLYKHLLAQMPSLEVLRAETQFARILRDQQKRGARLDRKAGEELLGRLIARRAELLEEIHAIFPPQLEYYKKRKDTGKRTKRYCEVRNGHFDNKLVPFNPDSRQQLAARLVKDRGWAPSELSQKTLKPLMHEAILVDLAEVYPEVAKVAEYYIVKDRISILSEGPSGYFSLCDENDVLHGRTIHIGAVTHRCTHSKPNTGNVTSLRKPYGKEIRSLFIPFEGFTQAGFDADGLELRMLAHYLAAYDEGRYIAAVLQGSKEDRTDPHSIHAQAYSTVIETDRDSGKNITYAIMYGAGDRKVGGMVGKGPKVGKRLKAALARHVHGLGPLLSDIKKRVESSGSITSLDGRRVGIRSPHAALNTLLQSAGAVCMKYMTNFLDDICTEEDIEFLQTGHIHDEVQGSLLPEHTEVFKKAVDTAALYTTEHLSLRIPLACTAKFGTSWAETH